jgi:uncharacterized protein YutE (UPF0331/DUF86 family)
MCTEIKINHVKYTIEGIKNYYNISSKSLEKEISELYSVFERENNSLFTTDNHLYSELYDSFVDFSENLEESFKRNLNYSFITLLYSFLESSLNDLCSFLKEQKNLDLNFNDLNREGIIRAKNYLEKVCKLCFSAIGNEWNEIEKLNKIRNCIVHTNGNVEKFRQTTKIKNIAEHTKYIELENDYLVVNNNYIMLMIEAINKFVLALYTDNLK